MNNVFKSLTVKLCYYNIFSKSILKPWQHDHKNTHSFFKPTWILLIRKISTSHKHVNFIIKIICQ